MKGISPLLAGVLMIAFTLAVAAIIGSWLTSISRTGTSQVESGFATTVNCSKGGLDIVSIPDATNIVIQNTGQISFSSGFSVSCGASAKSNTTVTLDTGAIATISNLTACNTNGNIIRVSSLDCPSVYIECTYGTDCPS